MTEALLEIAKIKLEAVYIDLRRRGLDRIAARLPIDLLDDVRLAVTEEMARRGYHVISHRPRSRKVA